MRGLIRLEATQFSSGSNSTTLMVDKGHIVHVTDCLTDGILTFLVDATRELDSLGYTQTIIFCRDIEPPTGFESYFSSSVTLTETRSLGSTLRRVVRETEPVAVHLHSFKAGLVGRAVMLTNRSRARVCYSPHGLSFLNSQRRLPSFGYWLMEWCAGLPKFQPVGSSKSEARLLEGVSRHEAFLLENPVADEFFSIEREPHPELTVVSIGRASEQKAPDVFGELAVRCSFHHGKPTRFVWVGTGTPEQIVKLRSAGVEVTGWVNSDVVMKWLATADVYVQTSRWEGLPLTVIQAMAAGVPCVVTDVVGNRDAIKNAHTGFVVGDQDTLERTVQHLLDDEVLRARVGQAARVDARNRFSRNRFRESLKLLYGFNG
ncbi:glycosyltransferase [soil metagenome]